MLWVIWMVFGLFEGKLEVFPDKTTYAVGEKITGRMRLTCNKPLAAKQLRIEFYGEVPSRDRDSDTTDRVFNTAALVSGEMEYSGTKDYAFEITVPQNCVQPKGKGFLGALGGMFNVTPKFFLHGSLDMPMKFDINSRVKLNILPPTQ